MRIGSKRTGPVHRILVVDDDAELLTSTMQGTGLGLAISRDIAEGALGGHLVLARSDRGARFELEFPRDNGKHHSPAPAWSPAKAA